jgi:hypothetical protein
VSRPDTLPEWATDTNYPAGSDPWSGLPTKRAPSAGEIAQGAEPNTGLAAQHFNYQLGLIGDWVAYLDGVAAAYFGDGSDGACVFDGTNTFAFASKSGNDYTLTRDVYAASMTFTLSATLRTAGYRIFCRGALDTSASALSGSIIVNYGGAASGATGGTGAPEGSVGGGSNGGTGDTSDGDHGVNIVTSYGGVGGFGDNGSFTNGDGGTVTAPSGVGASPRLFSPPMFGYVIGLVAGTLTAQKLQGGSGGGASGGNGVNNGGGGGGGGGVLPIAAHTLNLKSAGDIKAAGGAGGDVSGRSGGGGGGGVVLLVYCVVNSGITFSAATNCPGGAAGASPNEATVGANGSVFELVLGGVAGATTTATVVPQSGKEIITTDDEVTITFVGSFAYATATGANGYRFKTMVPYVSDGGDPVHPTVTAKTTTSFTVTFNRAFTGELDWETEGSV